MTSSRQASTSASEPPFHLLPFDYPIDNLSLLSSSQLALLQYHPDVEDDSILDSAYQIWFRRREKERNKRTFEEGGLDAFHLIDLGFRLDDLEALSSEQLAAVYFHPDAEVKVIRQAERAFRRRREREFAKRSSSAWRDTAAMSPVPTPPAQRLKVSQSVEPSPVPAPAPVPPVIKPGPSNRHPAPSPIIPPLPAPLPSPSSTARQTTPPPSDGGDIEAPLSPSIIQGIPLPALSEPLPPELARKALRTLHISNLPRKEFTSDRDVLRLLIDLDPSNEKRREFAGIGIRFDIGSISQFDPSEATATNDTDEEFSLSCLVAYVDFEICTEAHQALHTVKVGNWKVQAVLLESDKAGWLWGDMIAAEREDLWRMKHGVMTIEEEQERWNLHEEERKRLERVAMQSEHAEVTRKQSGGGSKSLDLTSRASNPSSTNAHPTTSGPPAAPFQSRLPNSAGRIASPAAHSSPPVEHQTSTPPPPTAPPIQRSISGLSPSVDITGKPLPKGWTRQLVGDETRYYHRARGIHSKEIPVEPTAPPAVGLGLVSGESTDLSLVERMQIPRGSSPLIGPSPSPAPSTLSASAPSHSRSVSGPAATQASTSSAPISASKGPQSNGPSNRSVSDNGSHHPAEAPAKSKKQKKKQQQAEQQQQQGGAPPAGPGGKQHQPAVPPAPKGKGSYTGPASVPSNPLANRLDATPRAAAPLPNRPYDGEPRYSDEFKYPHSNRYSDSYSAHSDSYHDSYPSTYSSGPSQSGSHSYHRQEYSYNSNPNGKRPREDDGRNDRSPRGSGPSHPGGGGGGLQGRIGGERGPGRDFHHY